MEEIFACYAYYAMYYCIYKVVFGMEARKLREKYEIGKKADLVDCGWGQD